MGLAIVRLQQAINAKIWSRKSGSREEIAPFEQLAHQNTEPDFHLIHPRSMLRRVVKHHLVGLVMQKRGTAFHRLQNPAFPFDAQRLSRNPFLFGYESRTSDSD
jgi:hypothetical protein